MDLDTLKMIVALAEEKSVIRAAERLNVKESEVYHFCDRFKRETRTDFLDAAFMNKFLSGQGMEVYEKAKQIISDIDGFNKWMSDLEPGPAGEITIVTTPFTGIKWLMPKFKVFLKNHPRVTMKLVLKNPPIQPGEGDVIITAPALIGPKGFNRWELVTPTYGFYASPAYLEDYGTPKKAEDLDNHRLISFKSGYTASEGYYDWSLTAGLRLGKKPRKPNFEVDSAIGTLEAAILGMGIAELPNADFIIQSNDLVHILPQLQSSETRI